MYSQGEIEDAVAAGALDPGQAASLRAFVAARNNTPTADEEYVRVWRGYNDGFVLYAVVVALLVAGWLGTLIPLGGRGPGVGPIPNLPFMAPLLVAAASWGLAEIFTLRRRTALASILLSFSFGLSVLVALAFILMPVANDPVGGAILFALCAAAAAGASWGFWLRFRVTSTPMVAVGLAILALCGMLGGLLSSSPSALDVINIVVLLCGLGVFAYAMYQDSADPWRISDRNEIGLWMHILASLLIVYPIAYLLGLSDGIASVGGAIAMIVLFLVMSLVGLAVNRKVYVLAGLSYLLVALNRLIHGQARGYSDPYDSYGGGFGGAYGGNPYGPPPAYGGVHRNPMAPDLINGTFATLLIVSLILLALAIWWAPLRRIVGAILPESIRARAPVVDAAPQAYAPPPQDYAPPPVAPPPPPPVA